MELNKLDIFCEIIDNYGDIGVVYRIAKEFKKINNNIKIRVFLNRIDEFLKINNKAKNQDFQIIDGIEYITFSYLRDNFATLGTSDVIIESFGCNIPNEYMDIAYNHSRLLINLEYLSGEDWIEDFHLQKSNLGKGSLEKVFFMPGFTEKSGGIIIDSNYLETIIRVEKNKEFYKKKFLGEIPDDVMIGTIFSYEKNFEPLLRELTKLDKNILLLILGEKSKESFLDFFKKNLIECLGNSIKYGKIDIRFMDFLNQEEYEELINVADFNFVRGEDSFIRAVLTGKPYIWHIYCQEDFIHLNKLDSFLEKYSRVIEDNEYLNEIIKVFKDYNFRKENNFDLGNENYSYFFQNLDKISFYNSIFKDFLIQKCNLINKLRYFILKY